jgi:hypothetical protein
MALGPEIFNQRFVESIQSIEQEIDRNLADKTPTSDGYINIYAPRQLDSSNFRIIQHKYLAAGWLSVEYHSDQREGEWMVFKLDKTKL